MSAPPRYTTRSHTMRRYGNSPYVGHRHGTHALWSQPTDGDVSVCVWGGTVTHDWAWVVHSPIICQSRLTHAPPDNDAPPPHDDNANPPIPLTSSVPRQFIAILTLMGMSRRTKRRAARQPQCGGTVRASAAWTQLHHRHRQRSHTRDMHSTGVAPADNMCWAAPLHHQQVRLFVGINNIGRVRCSHHPNPRPATRHHQHTAPRQSRTSAGVPRAR